MDGWIYIVGRILLIFVNLLSENFFTITHLASYIGIFEMIILSSSTEGKEIIEHVSYVYILVYKRKIFLSILMSSVVCVHFSQTFVNHFAT